tara:strand:- start:1017 stop:1142 length:126 start_codon:yes stop_codon:yes gene_type:complete
MPAQVQILLLSDNLPEWLMGTTRNRLGYARTGSNPVVVVIR